MHGNDGNDPIGATLDRLRDTMGNELPPLPDAPHEPTPSERGPLMTDLGNAQRLVRKYGRDIRWNPGWGYVLWTGARWERDRFKETMALAAETMQELYDEALVERDALALRLDKYDDPDTPEAQALAAKVIRADLLVGHAKRSMMAPRLNAIMQLAMVERATWLDPREFDADPLLLNVANGLLDLRTGKLSKHRRDAYQSKLAPVVYDPTATSPMFDEYLATTTGGDADFAEYLQRCVGYTLTGLTIEEKFFLLLGPSNTGKSSLIEGMFAIMGDYGAKSSFDAFCISRTSAGAAQPEIWKLQGRRLIAAVETGKDKRLNEPMVKELTGGDTISARTLYHEPVEFKPKLKLWLATNDSPKLTDTDTGIWRRLYRIPFEHVLTEADTDPNVKATLIDPNSDMARAFLAWAVRGCLTWQRDGLGKGIPEIVSERTTELRAEFDPLAEFFADCCVFDKKAKVETAVLRKAYELWADSMGAKAVGNQEWSKRLRTNGCERGRGRLHGLRQRIWTHIGLLEDKDY